MFLRGWRQLSFLLLLFTDITMMGIQHKNTRNSMKSKNYPKSSALRELENSTSINWYIVIKPSVPCSEQKGTSEKMSVDSVQS